MTPRRRPWLAACLLVAAPAAAGCQGSSAVPPSPPPADAGADVPAVMTDAPVAPRDGAAADMPGGPGPAYDGPILTQMEPSLDPPGGLAVERVPQFIVFGFDDNRYTDGMAWVLDTLTGKTNPAGSGNARTHDGRPLIVTFYHTTDALDLGGAELLAQWKRAKEAGHEVGNHTHTHRAKENEVPWDWNKEITQCNDNLSSKLGVPASEIIGFRAPFLQFEATLFDTLSQKGMLYDCSLTHIPIGGKGDDWQNYRHLWPYTLHNGTDGMSGQWVIGKHPGVWEIPVYTMPTVGPRRADAVVAPMAGFDSTHYGTLKRTAPQFFDSMKWALDLRLEKGDNRAPLTVGLHSDTYSEKQTMYTAPLAERRKAITDFIDYALTRPEVRFVSARQLLQWMSNPIPLDN